MQFSHQIHLAYCTNIHRGDDWAETFAGLKDYTLQVRRRVCPAEVPYAIGLRLSALAAQQLSDPDVLQDFREWLSREEQVGRAWTLSVNPSTSSRSAR
jgi:hypothetical protein